MNEQNLYCSAPWKGLTVRESGDVKTCCAGETPLGNLNSESIEQILAGDRLQEIKSQLSAGKRHENCRACYSQEDVGNNQTLRQHYQQHYPYTNDEIELRFLDIRWNNKCNLSCQYCVPSLSSTWERQLQIRSTSARKNYQDSLLEWILSKSDTVAEIMMVGGEPMLMKQNHTLLQQLPKACTISIITNLNYRLEDLSCWNALLERPRDQVIWNVSAENIKKQFEYVRNGSNWLNFGVELSQLIRAWPNTVCLNMVYSMFTAFDFAETVQYYRQLGVKKFNLMPITDCTEMDVFNWGASTRQRALEQLELCREQHQEWFGTDVDLYPFNGLDQLILDLTKSKNRVILDTQQFMDKVNWYNSWHDVLDFQALWPHVYKEATDYNGKFI